MRTYKLLGTGRKLYKPNSSNNLYGLNNPFEPKSESYGKSKGKDGALSSFGRRLLQALGTERQVKGKHVVRIYEKGHQVHQWSRPEETQKEEVDMMGRRVVHLKLEDETYFELLQLKGKVKADNWGDLVRKVITIMENYEGVIE